MKGFPHLKLSGIRRRRYIAKQQFPAHRWLETRDPSTRNWKVYPNFHSMTYLFCSMFRCFLLRQSTKSSRRTTKSLAVSGWKHVAIFPSTIQQPVKSVISEEIIKPWSNVTVFSEQKKSQWLSKTITYHFVMSVSRVHHKFNAGYEMVLYKPSTRNFCQWNVVVFLL